MLTVVVDRIPVKVALMDNKKLGMIRQWQEIIYGGNYHSSDLPAPTGTSWPRPTAGRPSGPRTPDEVDDAIRAAQAVDGPALVWFEIARDAERLPDDAGRQGPVRPHRAVGRRVRGGPLDGSHERPHRRARQDG